MGGNVPGGEFKYAYPVGEKKEGET